MMDKSEGKRDSCLKDLMGNFMFQKPNNYNRRGFRCQSYIQ